jgi:hypothetical protein
LIRRRPSSPGETWDAGSQGPPRRHAMSSNQKPRKDRAKDSASEASVSRKASAGGRKDGKFAVLPKSAGLKEHMAYMEKHTGAIRRSMRVDLGSSWCVGYELIRIKDKLGLKGENWDAHCKKVLPFTSRQAREYTVLAKAYSSAEEMIEKVGEKTSFANAVVMARALADPDPQPEPKPGKKDTDMDGENKPVTIEPSDKGDGGNGSRTDYREPPAPGSKGAEMLAEIMRIAARLADDLALLGKVHAILVKAEAKAARESASGNGRSKSKGKAKPRETAGKTRRGKAA